MSALARRKSFLGDRKMAKLKELQKKKRREKRFRREAKKALDPDERKTLKAIVELWFEAHPEILRNGLFSRMGLTKGSFIDDTVSLLEKGILKFEMTEYGDTELVRWRLYARDPNTGRWTLIG